MNQKYKEIPIYLFAIILALLIYWAFNQRIDIALKPHVIALQLLYQLRFNFIRDLGYGEIHGLFIIGRDCMGSKLFICLFFIFNICCLSQYKGVVKKLFMVFCFSIVSLLLAFVVTVIRISASIPFCNMPKFKLIHTMLSLMIYFGSALALYAFLNNKTQGRVK